MQPKGHPFGSPHHSHFPAGSSGVPHLTMPGGQQYVVTPSMVIPEADWEAAFSLGKPAQVMPCLTLYSLFELQAGT